MATLALGLVMGALFFPGIAYAPPIEKPVVITDPMDGDQAEVDGDGALKVTGSADPLPVSGTVSVGNLPTTQTVRGTIEVGNLPETQTIVGTVDVVNLPETQDVNVVGGALSVSPPVLTRSEDHYFDVDNYGNAGWTLSSPMNVALLTVYDEDDDEWKACLESGPESSPTFRVCFGDQGTPDIRDIMTFPQPIPVERIFFGCTNEVYDCDTRLYVAGN